jgi:hypothetical protein
MVTKIHIGLSTIVSNKSFQSFLSEAPVKLGKDQAVACVILYLKRRPIGYDRNYNVKRRRRKLVESVSSTAFLVPLGQYV